MSKWSMDIFVTRNRPNSTNDEQIEPVKIDEEEISDQSLRFGSAFAIELIEFLKEKQI